MKITRTRQITVERERTVVIKIKNAPVENFCAVCERAVWFVAASEAAQRRGVSEREIFRLVDAGEIHFAETEGGKLLVCLESLTGAAEI